MRYLLSVDGGGTKTEFCISDLDGQVIADLTCGSSNYRSIGKSAAYQNLEFGLEKIRRNYGISVGDYAYAFFGMSGCDTQEDFNTITKFILSLGFDFNSFRLSNDGLMAFYAQADNPGIVIISGTGSIVYGVDENEKEARAGGWGYNISDIGSGYWIGNEALKKTLLYCDGCIAYSPIFDVIGELTQAGMDSLPFYISNIHKNQEIAGYAQTVTDMAAKNDLVAMDILREGSGILAQLAYSVAKKLDFPGKKINVVLSGGVYKSQIYQKLTKKALSQYLSEQDLLFYSQTNKPSYGGIRLAKRLFEKGCI